MGATPPDSNGLLGTSPSSFSSRTGGRYMPHGASSLGPGGASSLREHSAVGSHQHHHHHVGSQQHHSHSHEGGGHSRGGPHSVAGSAGSAILGSSPRVGSLASSLPIPKFQHPSHALLEDNGFKQVSAWVWVWVGGWVGGAGKGGEETGQRAASSCFL